MFTNISNDHIGPNEHADFAEYLYWKCQLLKKCRVAIVNRDDEHFEEICRNAGRKVFTYSLEQDADFMAKDIHYVAEPDFVGLDFDVTGQYELNVKVNIPGRFNVYNALAAVAVCSYFDLPKDRICHALEHLYVNGRMEIVHTSKRCTVIVDYAHNAISMESLLKTLRDYHPKRLVCVFGCGGNRSKLRRYEMGEVSGKLADFTIITSDNPRFEEPQAIIDDILTGMKKTDGEYISIIDRREAISYAMHHAQPGDIVVLAGKGHETYQEIKGKKYHMSEEEIVQDVLDGKY